MDWRSSFGLSRSLDFVFKCNVHSFWGFSLLDYRLGLDFIKLGFNYLGKYKPSLAQVRSECKNPLCDLCVWTVVSPSGNCVQWWVFLAVNGWMLRAMLLDCRGLRYHNMDVMQRLVIGHHMVISCKLFCLLVSCFKKNKRSEFHT